MKNSITRVFVIFWMVTATSHSKARLLKYFKAKIQGYTFGKVKHFRDLWLRIESIHYCKIMIRKHWGNHPCSHSHHWLELEGMELLYMHTKWMTLYHTRCLKETKTLCVITTEGYAIWKHFLTTDNPPNLWVRARELEYIRTFFQERY